jgi:hypothetical protein
MDNQLTSNDNKEGRAKNRRVEFIIDPCEFSAVTSAPLRLCVKMSRLTTKESSTRGPIDGPKTK